MKLNITRQPLVMVTALILLLTIACGGIELWPQAKTASGSLTVTRLPTLTRTPLPTLTPTSPANPVAVALSPDPSGVVPPPDSPAVELVATPTVVEATQPAPSPSSLPVVVNSGPTADAAAISQSAPGLTNTPTSLPTETATVTPVPTNTPAATPTSTPVVKTPDWIFANVLVYPDQYEDGLLLYGEMINNTGVAQQLEYISGTFYDAQGQIVADENSTGDYWPFKLIPAGEGLPFGLFVDGIYSAANFDLQVQADSSSETLRHDLQFLDLSQWVNEIGEYCVAGELRNPGGELQEYVVMMAILYDSQEKVVNFGDELEPFPRILGDDTLEFEICVQTLGQTVARHELRAWAK